MTEEKEALLKQLLEEQRQENEAWRVAHLSEKARAREEFGALLRTAKQKNKSEHSNYSIGTFVGLRWATLELATASGNFDAFNRDRYFLCLDQEGSTETAWFLSRPSYDVIDGTWYFHREGKDRAATDLLQIYEIDLPVLSYRRVPWPLLPEILKGTLKESGEPEERFLGA